jgi:glutathione S-transferase
MALTLYVGSKRYSSWSLRPYVALAHARATFETRTIILDQADSKANIAKVTPSARVPVLYDDKLVIWDSLAIIEYVNELHPEAQLWPADRALRAQARAIAAEMHSGFAALRTHMPMDLGGHKPDVGRTPEVLADIARITQIWRERLAASKAPFLFGAFGAVDAMFAPVTTRFVTYAVDLDAPARAYVDAMHALPAMKQWHADAAAEPVTRG